MFSKGVVLVESDGDREVYQAAAEAIEDYPSRELHFAPVGGTGGFVNPARFYRSLNIPIAVVIDLDALCDIDRVVAIATILGSKPGDTDAAIGKLKALAQRVKSLPPEITEERVKSLLDELSKADLHWNSGDDNSLRRKLGELSRKLSRIGRLKEGGISAYADQPELQRQIEEVVEQFSQFGLFFAPAGELEDWVPQLMTDIPKGSKSKTDRAAIAAERIREASEKTGDVWAFVKNVLEYLRPDRARS